MRAHFKGDYSSFAHKCQTIEKVTDNTKLSSLPSRNVLIWCVCLCQFHAKAYLCATLYETPLLGIQLALAGNVRLRQK